MAEKISGKESGLKYDLLKAKLQVAKAMGIAEEDMNVDKGSPADVEAEYIAIAIKNFMAEAEFTITELKAPIIVEDIKTPDMGVNVKLETLLGDKAPILKTLKQVGNLIPGVGKIVDQLVGELESAIKQAVTPLLEAGANLPGMDFTKGDSGNDGGLQSTGYAFIGEDPDSQQEFDVTNSEGQRVHTTVKLLPEDIERLL
tara:strand:- start:56 stop:655 length:600 start_codon:yes stop_codon:yes gene_type:complete